MVSAHCTSNNMPLPCKVTNRHPSLPILNQSRRGPHQSHGAKRSLHVPSNGGINPDLPTQ